MLRSISILNYALIRSLTVDLGEGLNVITGETGAGKSIVIDAISLLLGERGSKDNLRIGSDRMTVSASFDTPEPGRDDALIAILDEAGIDASEELIVSREMDKRGRSVCRINGVIVPLALLKKTGPQLIDVHGQHEHASLFKAENHRIQLDAYAGEEAAAILTKLSETAGSFAHRPGPSASLNPADGRNSGARNSTATLSTRSTEPGSRPMRKTV